MNTLPASQTSGRTRAPMLSSRHLFSDSRLTRQLRRAAAGLPAALLAFAAACADAPTGLGSDIRPQSASPSASGAAGQWTMIEGFEAGNLASYTTVAGGYNDPGSADAAAAHDGAYGLRTGNATWIYRSDVSVQLTEGDKLSAWVRFADVTQQNSRINFGFGGTAAGAVSLALKPTEGNPGTIYFMEHPNYNFFGELPGAAPVAFAAGVWYRVEVVVGANGRLSGSVYEGGSTTPLATATHTTTIPLSGWIAIRDNYAGDSFDTVQWFDADATAPAYAAPAGYGAPIPAETDYQDRAFKAGSTLPLKLAVTQNGAPAPADLAITLSVTKVGAVAGTDAPETISLAADRGTTFRYDAASGQYILNYGTTKGQKGTYRVVAAIGTTILADQPVVLK